MFDIWPTDQAERKGELGGKKPTYVADDDVMLLMTPALHSANRQNENLDIFNGNEYFKRNNSHTQCNSIREKKTVAETKSKKCCEVSFWLFFFVCISWVFESWEVTIADNYTIPWKLIAVIAVGPDYMCVCSMCMVLGAQLCTNTLEFCGKTHKRGWKRGIKQQRIANIAKVQMTQNNAVVNYRVGWEVKECLWIFFQCIILRYSIKFIH